MSRGSTARILVTGGAGFLGRAIAYTARATGFDVQVTWRTTPPPDGIPAHRLAVDDLLATEELVSRLRPDVVVVALGGPHLPTTADHQLAVWRDAPVATASLLEACRPHPMHVVLLASSHEFAPSAVPHDELAAVGPVSLRGIASRAAVDTVRLWAKETGAPITILRPFSVYGPGEPSSRVVPTLIRSATTGAPFHATATATGRDLVFIDDVAQAVVRACSQATTGEFNLGTGISTSIPELVQAVEQVTGRPIDVRPGTFEPRPWDRESWVADPTRAAVELGWTATTSLIEGLRRSLP